VKKEIVLVVEENEIEDSDRYPSEESKIEPLKV
jgi:hypothetical protein